MVSKINQIYPPELQLSQANAIGTKAKFLDLRLSSLNGFVSSKFYDERDDVQYIIFPFLDGDIPRRASYDVNISQLRSFAIMYI